MIRNNMLRLAKEFRVLIQHLYRAAYGEYCESHKGHSSTVYQDDGVVSGCEVLSCSSLVGRVLVEGRFGVVMNLDLTRRALLSHYRQCDVKWSLCRSEEERL